MGDADSGGGLVLRPAGMADSPTIWAMLEPVFRAGDTYAIEADIDREAALDYWLGGNHTVYLASQGDVALGTYYICPNQRGGGGHVCNCGFVTAPAARGRGVAQAMLAHALETARSAGFLAMQFNFVVSTNTRAIAIWEGAGFETLARLPGAFRHPDKGLVDALVMFRRL
jgi:GNAT superfamily N-acetyltransferase